MYLIAPSLRSSFNPRTPCGVRQRNKTMSNQINLFQSTHSLRSATSMIVSISPAAVVSIHALLAECDRLPTFPRMPSFRFNPRTPCGVRLSYGQVNNWMSKFQSTHSLRSATGPLSQGQLATERFNPRTPCGVRPHIRLMEALSCTVSIHALLAECDIWALKIPNQSSSFQSTHSLRSATESA